MKEINNINEYISAAKARSGVKSNRKIVRSSRCFCYVDYSNREKTRLSL